MAESLRDVSKQAGFDPHCVERAVHAGDYDNDGATDFAVTSLKRRTSVRLTCSCCTIEKNGKFKDVTAAAKTRR